VHSTYVFFVPKATKDGKNVKPAVIAEDTLRYLDFSFYSNPFMPSMTRYGVLHTGYERHLALPHSAADYSSHPTSWTNRVNFHLIFSVVGLGLHRRKRRSKPLPLTLRVNFLPPTSWTNRVIPFTSFFSVVGLARAAETRGPELPMFFPHI